MSSLAGHYWAYSDKMGGVTLFKESHWLNCGINWDDSWFGTNYGNNSDLMIGENLHMILVFYAEYFITLMIYSWLQMWSLI